MEKDGIETRTAKIWFGEDGILYVVHHPGSEITLADAEEEVAAVAKVCPSSNRAPLFSDISKVRSTSREARQHFTKEKSPFKMSALALLVKTPVSRIIGNFYLGLNKPNCPTKLFSSKSEALEWLKGFIE